MNSEYASAGADALDANPMRLTNFFYVVLGTLNIALALWSMQGVTRAISAGGWQAGLGLRVTVVVLMLVLGALQFRQAMRHFKISYTPEEIGPFVSPGGDSSNRQYLASVAAEGISKASTPDSALGSMLYGLIPKLAYAPVPIRYHAEMQLRHAAHVLVLILCFGLAWLFAQPAVFAWMALAYFVIAVAVLKPHRTLQRIGRGVTDTEAGKRPLEIKLPLIMMLVVASVILPAVLQGSVARIPPTPFNPAVVIVPTVAILGSTFIASVLFVLALIAQTRSLASSGVTMQVVENHPFRETSSGLLDTWLDNIPVPRRRYSHDRQARAGTANGEFSGEIMFETEPTLNAGSSAGTLREAFSAAWASESDRPLLGLQLFGLMLGVAAAFMAMAFSRYGQGALVGLVALAFLASSQFALLSAHRLWLRTDFSSTVYWLRYRGAYKFTQSETGNVLHGEGTLREERFKLLNSRLEICVMRIGSVCFGKKETRLVTSVDLLSEECRRMYDLAVGYAQSARHLDREGDIDELERRNLLATPPALPTVAAESSHPVVPQA
ncbi:hypothetical protein OK348_02505 [Flavobacterium sp. MXW15]|uniref:PH domain-containing protein n=1 Tax=Xanthomonas chitinilytica TaxID=2989819 RepID=A0ABT3JS16_9XANT|nr:hypothetical protein [Xanthomonas sp. H13-6]MCW4453665.1 hypothetical protein [Flavobacterium sp. MXW15]MCW4471284.1 hypothetical protein [Xanthomonas sp. H13-6]